MRIITALLTALILALPAHASSRIKDMVDIEDVRDNQIVGYGLVVGLDGTGDSLRNSAFTNQSLNAMLERFNVNTRDANLNTRNVAAVMVTASLPAFSSQGTRIDVTISAIGDAGSLQGGTLIATPLLDSYGRTWAVAQGSLTVGGFQAQGDAASITRGVPTSGRIASGAIVENPFAGTGIDPWAEIANRDSLALSLRNPDFTTARRMADAINAYIGRGAARAENPSTVRLNRTASYDGDMIDLLADYYEQALTAPQDELVPVRQEIDAQLQYLDIERIRFPERLDVEVDLPRHLEGALLPTLMIQPLIENSIKHAVAAETSRVTVRIAVSTAGDTLVIRVTDQCDDPGERPARTGTGTGLQNIRNRLDTVHGDRASLEAGPTRNGFSSTLSLPLLFREAAA